MATELRKWRTEAEKVIAKCTQIKLLNIQRQQAQGEVNISVIFTGLRLHVKQDTREREDMLNDAFLSADWQGYEGRIEKHEFEITSKNAVVDYFKALFQSGPAVSEETAETSGRLQASSSATNSVGLWRKQN